MSFVNDNYVRGELTRYNVTTCMINGEVIEYDAMSKNRDVPVYDKMFYIGQGSIYSIDGHVYTDFESGSHFWSRTSTFRLVEEVVCSDDELYFYRMGVEVLR